MKSVILALVFVCTSVLVFGQDEDEYYRVPSQRHDVKNNVYPNLDRKAINLYLGLEGGLESNHSTLINNLDGLIGKQKGSDLYWGIVLGYNMNHLWSIETGFYKNPTYLVQSVSSGRSIPYIYRFGTGLQTIPVRYKRRVLTIDPITKNATIHVGVGVLLSPEAKTKKIGERNFVGYSSSGPQRRDTLTLKSEAFLDKSGIAQGEFMVELHGRISSTLSIVVFARGNVAPKGIVNSDINYAINSVVVDKARQVTNGISFNFGLVFRYNIMRGYKYLDKNEE